MTLAESESNGQAFLGVSLEESWIKAAICSNHVRWKQSTLIAAARSSSSICLVATREIKTNKTPHVQENTHTDLEMVLRLFFTPPAIVRWSMLTYCIGNFNKM